LNCCHHILKLICTKFDFGWNPAGSLHRSPDAYLDLRGLHIKEERERSTGGKGEGWDRGVEGREKEGREGEEGRGERK